MISFDVPGTPAPKGSMRRVRGGALIHDNKRTMPWAEAVGWHARQYMHAQRKTPISGAVVVQVCFYLPRPKSVKRPLHVVKPDVDKLARNALDALKLICWNDDAQVVSLTATKQYADTPRGARMHVVINEFPPTQGASP